MELSLLKAASDAANTTARLNMLEGLVEGDERQIIRTLEENPEHGELLGDDFFWCYMGLGMTMGGRGFWRAIGDWGYSLDSVVPPPPDLNNELRKLETSPDGMTLAQWGIRFLPLERLQWLGEIGLLEPWEQAEVALHGMLYNSREVSDWLQAGWKDEVSKDPRDWKRKLLPSELVRMGKIISFLKTPESRDSLQGTQGAEELQERYESFCSLYLENKHSGLTNITDQKKEFLTELPPAQDGEDEFSQWLVDSAPEIFSSSWPDEALSTNQESWVWAKALWNAGAPAGDAETPDSLFSKAREIMIERHGDAESLVESAIKQWMKRSGQENIQRFLEGASDSLTSPLLQFVEEGQWKLASLWISLGARLDRRNDEGGLLGAKILSLSLSGDNEAALGAWDAYRKRAAKDDPFPPSNQLLEVKGKELEWFVQEEEGQVLALDAIMNGTFPAREPAPFRGRF